MFFEAHFIRLPIQAAQNFRGSSAERNLKNQNRA